MDDAEPQRSRLAAAIEQQPRKVHEFEVGGFFGLGNKPVLKVGIRVNTKGEENKAIDTAHRYGVAELSETARADMDFLGDEKTVHALYQACRRCEEDDAPAYRYPAFPSPSWMREHLTTDQLATLLNLYNEVRKKEGGGQWEISFEIIESLSRTCADLAESDVPDEVLARCSREWLSQAFVMLSMRYHESLRRHDRAAGSDNAGDEGAEHGTDDDAPGHSGGSTAGAGDAPLPEPDGQSGGGHES